MIFGLQTLFNKIKNSQAAVYRDGIRNGGFKDGELDSGNDKFKGKGRAVGIGEDQPSRETIELELMRFVFDFSFLRILIADADTVSSY